MSSKARLRTVRQYIITVSITRVLQQRELYARRLLMMALEMFVFRFPYIILIELFVKFCAEKKPLVRERRKSVSIVKNESALSG